MQKLIQLSVVPVLLTLGACSSDSKIDLTGDGAGNGFELTTVSGNTMATNGTYSTGCYATGGGSTKEDMVFSSDTMNRTNTDYTSADCSGTAAATHILAATITSVGISQSIVGWVDGNRDPALAPTAANGSGPLSDTESYSPIHIFVDNATGDFAGALGAEFPIFFIVDDTGAAPVLYRDEDTTHAVAVDSFTKQL